MRILKPEEYRNLRNIEKMNDINRGNRCLFESIVSTEVLQALSDWISNSKSDFVIIGGLALSYYIKPRMTMDVDVLFLSSEDIPDKVEDFKRHRPSTFQHNKTHVEVEVITPKLINTSIELIKKVFETAENQNGVKIASPSGIVALKLGRFNRQDQADIENLKQNYDIDLTPFNLSQEFIDKYNTI